MAIKNIAQGEFQPLVPEHEILDGFIGTEVEWYANDAKTILGVIALDNSGKTWNYVVFRRQVTGAFRACKLSWDCDDRQVARVQLLLAMEANEKGDQQQPHSDRENHFQSH